ncbi:MULTISPECIES: sulfite exporter TauE/SafE family protein [unclassified Myroides]|uniref:sulfite exporter TauE/SafE family protein n=1 Tax=unclassified Myroides TaxID=2642485 RepID=UPI0015FA2093|nr:MULTISPECIES: sulfite exporter TauE/SafE family protein [unclassified Myroides]MBB1148944.1 sulfite exporter TauE/SafE family protein [Myroides sp. NP-2]MDM1408131.1 sulfite exporter TauE/SafE family protein [Myroides sp. DF42-4-2]
MISALIFGLVSSLHCIGMCGPIALMLPISQNNQVVKIRQMFTYHIGRIAAYSLLGFVFGLFGKGLFLAGFQQQLSIVVGIIMIVLALVPTNRIGNFNLLKPMYRFVNWIKSSLGKQFKKKSPNALFFIGFFNGFLPCGMVYVALFGALATQDVFLGMAYMAFFGLGTIPLMSLVIYFKNLFSERFRRNVMKYYPVVIVLIGMLFIIRGLGLNIPFLSPDTLNLFVRGEAMC